MRSSTIFVATTLLSSGPSTISAFTAAPSRVATTTTTATTTSITRNSSPLHATIAASELATMSNADQIAALGISDSSKLALGIDSDEVLEFIGTRDDLIAKFRADMPSLGADSVEAEVDKFLMDGEMLDLMIKYSQRKAEDPEWEPIYQPEPSVVVKVVNFASQYAIWFVGAFLLKDVVTNFMAKNAATGAADGAEVLVSLNQALDSIHHVSNTLV
mmetsp:Transcript_21453/g.34877  ORF Transcript_21453/g.34877 Transcript_21453/m.34877 type:complete len:216 (+) Transcript_21453:13-660(+)